MHGHCSEDEVLLVYIAPHTRSEQPPRRVAITLEILMGASHPGTVTSPVYETPAEASRSRSPSPVGLVIM